MARDIQRELKRVGCYDGEATGDWSAATRRAMKSFTDRVNATLPVEEPDYILLTLIQGHNGKACGRTCPAGQGLSEDGKCMPSALLAQAARKAAIKRPTVAAPSPAPSSNGPSVANGAPAEPARGRGASSNWDATVAIAPVTPRGESPVGRMAVGGPALPQTATADIVARSLGASSGIVSPAPVVTNGAAAQQPGAPRTAAIAVPLEDARDAASATSSTAEPKKATKPKSDRGISERDLPPDAIVGPPPPRSRVVITAPPGSYPGPRPGSSSQPRWAPALWARIARDAR